MQNDVLEKIPVSVLVVTKNEEERIGRCLEPLSDFAEVIVIDSQSSDRTQEIAKNHNAKVVEFRWSGGYPKKRQWCIDTVNIGYEWVLWIDADEVVTTGFLEEILNITKNDLPYCGYFVESCYVWKEKPLKYGLRNNKLALYHKSMVEFPIVDDLDIEGMGEIEGHFQPIKKQGYEDRLIGQITNPILHYAYEDEVGWQARHERYALWESQMILRAAYPKDPVFCREWLKKLTRGSCLRPWLMFLYSYVFRLGFLDGKDGFDFAMSRKNYCDMVLAALKKAKKA